MLMAMRGFQYSYGILPSISSMAISGTDLLEVPTIYNSGLNFREYPHRIWPDK